MKYLLILAMFMVGCTQQIAPEVDTTIKKYVPNTSKEKLIMVFHTASMDDIDKFYEGLQYAYYFDMKTKMNEDMYLATVLTEVGSNLVGVRENLNYSCEALPSIFSYYREHGGYNTDGRCSGHDANQYVIGSKVYSNRLGNGDVASGDGYTYRGGGYAQTTGKYNYSVITDDINHRVGSNFTPAAFANNITNTYIANLGGLGYWLQVGAGVCTTMDCVTDKWNYYTDSREERNANYNWIKEM